ncbi:zinc finger protein 395a isoform 2-T3 [Menidia menidia]
MIPKTRLGKRSPLGALLSSACPPGGTHLEQGRPVPQGAGLQGISRVKGHADLKVYFQCGGPGEASGAPPHGNVQAEAPPPSAASGSRSVSSSIDVPKRTPQEVDVDELMAAMVLSSLSCSPPPKGPAPPDAADGAGSELSDSGSSGYWSIGRAAAGSAPCSPAAAAEPEAAAADEGLDMELVLFDEPAPRKRRNSVKAAFRCLWPSCGKELTSVVGIKRHIRTTHLSPGAEREVDFYYTEISQWEPTVTCGPAPCSPPSPPPPPLSPPAAALSSSAPSPSGSLWQVQSEHSYQAPPPSPLAAAALSHLMAPPPTCTRPAVAPRVRSVSVGEQWLQQHTAPCRRIRSEAKKCRKVYGIEHREQWCTACRWKKACQRFLD